LNINPGFSKCAFQNATCATTPRHYLTLTQTLADSNRIPREYDMQTTPDDQPIHVFSDVREDTAAAAAVRVAAMAAAARVAGVSGGGFGGGGRGPEIPPDEFILEGRVSEKFDVRPSSVSDAMYREVSKQRIQDATKKTRIVQAATGPQRTVPLPKARNMLQRMDGKKDEPVRRERMERGALEDRLMGLYERRNLWTFKQLVAETRQPAEFLKEVLGGLAVLNRRGPNAGQYSLKDMYKKKGAGGAEGGGGAK
jgi:transcription initiation factor TFIIF subunit beta